MCTNFSTRTIELRPSEHREILHFPFSSFLPFSFPFLLYFSTNSFCFFFSPLFYFSLFLFLISFSPHFFSFLSTNSFSPPFFVSFFLLSLLLFFSLSFSLWICIDRIFQWRKLPPHYLLNFLFSKFFFMTSSPTWLNVSHEIISHTWLIVSHSFKWTTWLLPSVTLLRCHVASPNHTICHPTPHALKNVKFRLLRNPTKFDVVTRFRETISTEKSVSLSEI